MKQILGTLVLMPVEELLNRLIRQDPFVVQSLLPFNGKILEISTQSPTAVLTIRFQGTRVRLSALATATTRQQPDAAVAGDTGELLSLLLSGDSKPLANPRIRITGDALLVQDLFNLLRTLDIDWRDYLAPLFGDTLGDVVTQELGQLGTQARQWGTQAQANLRRSLADYVKEEVSLVPDPAELDQFSDQMDQLKLAIDRLEARTRLLQSRLDKSLKNQHLSP